MIQVKIKENLKKLNNILEENDPLIDFIAKIVLAIITISIAINANNIAKKQTEIDEINIIPNINIERNTNKYDMSYISIYNDGGPVYDLQSEAYTNLNIMYSVEDDDIQIPIIQYLKTETGNQTGLLLQYNEYVHAQTKELEEYLNKRLSEQNLDYTVNAYTSTYIKISYLDKFNNKTKRYFIDNRLLSERKGVEIEENYSNATPKRLIQSNFEEFYNILFNKITSSH